MDEVLREAGPGGYLYEQVGQPSRGICS
jgi:hypothetical protein